MKTAETLRFILNNIDDISKRKECTARLEALLREAEEVTNVEEETGKWVLLCYSPHEPVQVYGFFNTEDDAYIRALEANFIRGSTYSVHMVLNAHMKVRREAWE